MFGNKYTFVYILILCLATFCPCRTVSKYRVWFGMSVDTSDLSITCALRSFTLDKIPSLLIIDPQTLAMRIVAKQDTEFDSCSFTDIRESCYDSPYILAIDSAEKNMGRPKDAGLGHIDGLQKGIGLTADLCPSKKPLARSFFDTLIAQFSFIEKPVPIALAVSGNWMYTHRADLKWLMNLEETGDLRITWINHSYNHRISKDPPRRNFLLQPGTDMNIEVLNTERKMIEYGLTPSAYFRFPGLVSDSLLFVKVLSFGLVPVGSDAWLAKDQKPADGSIVLIHANGNEPYGIKQFFDLVKNHRDSIRTGSWLLYDLGESISGKSEY